jgi:predicted membrane protein
MVMIVHVASTEIHALHASIAIPVHRVTVMIVLVVSIVILVLLVTVMIVHAVLTETLVHLVMAVIVLVVSIVILVHRVTVMIAHVVSIVILVHRVTVMIAHAVLTAMIVLVVSIVMIAHVALIATTAHRAQQRKNVQTKCVVALANAVRPEKCQQRQSVHVKSGLTKGQCVRNVIQTWVAFAPKAQAVRKKADEKKCVHSTPLWNSLSVH